MTMPWGHLEKGTILEGWAAYDHRGSGTEDEDDAFVSVRSGNLDSDVGGVMWEYGVSDTYPGADVPWAKWQFVVPETGDYYVYYAVASGTGTTALFDGAQILPSTTDPVPEPLSFLLFGSGMGALCWRRRKD